MCTDIETNFHYIKSRPIVMHVTFSNPCSATLECKPPLSENASFSDNDGF